MFELTPENAADYLRRSGRVSAGPVAVAELSGGVSNAVLRVEADGRRFVLKQSRPRLRTRAEWLSDVERVYREQEVMEELAPRLPGVVPAVLFADRPNFVFAMEHAPDDAVVWKTALLAGAADPALAALAGTILGQMHEATATPSVVERFRDPTAFVQLRVDPFYRRVQQARPEVAAAVAPLIERLLTRRLALCHGDYSPKNLLAHAGGLTLVDYETAYGGDPAMDLGFFVSHLLLKSLHRRHEQGRYLGLVRSFWAGYGAAVRSLDLADLEAAGVGHCGVCLLARVDGTSPVDYLSGPGQEAARVLGRRVLLDEMRRWDEVLDAAAR